MGTNRDGTFQDISRSPHTSLWRWARYTPPIATHAIHKNVVSARPKRSRMVTFHRQDTGAEDVNMIRRQRSWKSVFSHTRSFTSSWAWQVDLSPRCSQLVEGQGSPSFAQSCRHSECQRHERVSAEACRRALQAPQATYPTLL